MAKPTLPHDKISLLQLAYKGLNDEELEEIATLTRFNTYPADHILCHEGAYEDVLYIVADGNVVITQKISEDEDTRVLRVGGKGEVVGEMALLQDEPRSATVRTTSACTVLEMDKKDFEIILKRNPRMAIDLVRITLDRIRENDKKAIAELKKSNKTLCLMDRNKLEFIQIAAHELRTPLTVLKGYVNMLHSFPEIQRNANYVEILEGIDKGSNRMHEVVNTMLDVTRIDAEVLMVASVLVPLKQVVNDVVHGFSQAATERKIKINIRHHAGVPNIYADPTLIQKALYHLIINAIKYTPDGGKVFISTRPVIMEGDRKGVEVAVKDTGIGLDPEYHELVFEKFYQVGDVAIHSSGKTTFKGGGSGLGLAIVHGVAHAHGGKVWVESTGCDEVHFPGSTFYLQLPVNL